MSKKECIKFGYAIGNQPAMGDHWEVWKQIKAQSKLILEEVNELEDACSEEDLLEVLDAVMDIKYLNTYLEHLLEAYGCKTKLAWETVCSNNAQKITNSLSYAKQSKGHREYEIGEECYVDETIFEGEQMFTVKRCSDNKVMKLLNHERPDLSICIPEEFKL